MSTLVSLASLASLAAFAVVAARSSSSSSSSMVFERQHEQHTPITLDASVCRPESSSNGPIRVKKRAIKSSQKRREEITTKQTSCSHVSLLQSYVNESSLYPPAQNTSPLVVAVTKCVSLPVNRSCTNVDSAICASFLTTL